MAWNQADVDALKTAIAQGVRTVQYGDQAITYHSLQDMLSLLTLMQTEVAGTTGTATPGGTGRQRHVYSSKGF